MSDDRPLDILNNSIGSPVLVRLKRKREFRGTLRGYDVHMNVVLEDAEELSSDSSRTHDTLIVRGDNVVYISP
ncbi:MAG: Small nuclear ribonucleoprotein [Candidatus Methanohalarchaeum thermophilum]|uniref:Putative snRNP Sm-like protein n=1 Tax=Methanohalarchaeum thermophilum TaxID=1903181 RepID=A0A1Q6DXT7_METT1|nr:MAG: Small nuclear ribonucleoprotein [Candidatus Methanohalarchaeum thermophilum]